MIDALDHRALSLKTVQIFHALMIDLEHFSTRAELHFSSALNAFSLQASLHSIQCVPMYLYCYWQVIGVRRITVLGRLVRLMHVAMMIAVLISMTMIWSACLLYQWPL